VGLAVSIYRCGLTLVGLAVSVDFDLPLWTDARGTVFDLLLTDSNRIHCAAHVPSGLFQMPKDSPADSTRYDQKDSKIRRDKNKQQSINILQSSALSI
jgi:hypothetical protein